MRNLGALQQETSNGTEVFIIISGLQDNCNLFQPIPHRSPGVVGLRCNVRQWEPLNVPQ